MLIPSSSMPSGTYLKYLAVGYLLLIRCEISLPRIPTFGLLLPPVFIIRLSLLANSYPPHKPFGNFPTLSRLNRYHLFGTGIMHLQTRSLALAPSIMTSAFCRLCCYANRLWTIVATIQRLNNLINNSPIIVTPVTDTDCVHTCEGASANHYYTTIVNQDLITN